MLEVVEHVAAVPAPVDADDVGIDLGELLHRLELLRPPHHAPHLVRDAAGVGGMRYMYARSFQSTTLR